MTTETVDVYSLSDEELLNMPEESFVSEQPEEEQETQNEETPTEEQETTETSEQEANEESNTDEQATEDVEEVKENAIDYEAFYKKVTSTFKANGKEMSLDNPEDIITLMQQGAGYSKRMEQLKPKQAILKTLEQHGLLDTDKLSYLIDLHDKKPEAIAKLIKEAELDVYSLDTDEADKYVPENKVTEVTPLEDVLEQMKDSPTYAETVSSVANDWDSTSKEIFSKNPNMLLILDNHMQTGQYRQVMDIIERERMLGRLTNISTIDAYTQVEQMLANAQEQQSKPTEQFTGARPNVNEVSNNNEQRKKASNPTTTTSSTSTEVDFYKMSDAEILAYTQ